MGGDEGAVGTGFEWARVLSGRVQGSRFRVQGSGFRVQGGGEVMRGRAAQACMGRVKQ